MMPVLKNLMPSREEQIAVEVLNNDYELQFGEENNDTRIPMHQFYLIGNLKFIFIMLRHCGFLGKYFLHAEWKKKHHVELNLIYCGMEEWTTIEKELLGLHQASF
jgi:hypothetical protein